MTIKPALLGTLVSLAVAVSLAAVLVQRSQRATGSQSTETAPVWDREDAAQPVTR